MAAFDTTTQRLSEYGYRCGHYLRTQRALGRSQIGRAGPGTLDIL